MSINKTFSCSPIAMLRVWAGLKDDEALCPPQPHTLCLTFLIFPCKVSFSSEEQRLLRPCSELRALLLGWPTCLGRILCLEWGSLGPWKDHQIKSQEIWAVGPVLAGCVTLGKLLALWSSASSSEW